METFKIDGPVAVLEYAGNIKGNVKHLPFVAAAWLSRGNTMVAIKLSGIENEDEAQKRIAHVIVQNPMRVHFSKSGCDLLLEPNGQN